MDNSNSRNFIDTYKITISDQNESLAVYIVVCINVSQDVYTNKKWSVNVACLFSKHVRQIYIVGSDNLTPSATSDFFFHFLQC